MAQQVLAGKVALVTGGASGLGKAIVTKYLEAGARVIICDINEERITRTISELSGKGTIKGYVFDISNHDQVEQLFEKISTEVGSLNILVNNAGIMDRFDPAGDLDPALWDRVIAVNLTALFLLTRKAIQIFLAQEKPDGYILNIASMAGKVGLAAGVAYTAAKHGLVGLTKNTSSFYADKGIRCNAFMMGAMNTNVTDAFRTGINKEGYQKTRDAMEALRIPLCDLDDVADLCVELSHGARSRLLNGALIHVDNGWGSMMG
ncbi:short chain dehydrogenase/oxidoreductase [Aspergillus carlsbadensis]|nr:short chain dehydrogenase/oxidoreductase [Aspergillus carlsbadensis]